MSQPCGEKCGLNVFAGSEPMAIHAGNGWIRALPAAARFEIMDRLQSITRRYGLNVLVCACNNPDIASSSCHIAGCLPPAARESRQLGLFHILTVASGYPLVRLLLFVYPVSLITCPYRGGCCLYRR